MDTKGAAMSSSIRDIFRPRRRYPLDERTPDGRSVGELVQAVTQQQMPQQVAQQPVTPTVQAPMPAQRPVAPVQQAIPRNDSPTATRDRRTEPRDYIADD